MANRERALVLAGRGIDLSGNCLFFWLLFFGQAKKSDPSAAGDRKLGW
jgi:hypothetical protein